MSCGLILTKNLIKMMKHMRALHLTSKSYHRELSISNSHQVLFALPKSSASSISFKLYVPTEIILVHLPPCLQKKLLAAIDNHEPKLANFLPGDIKVALTRLNHNHTKKKMSVLVSFRSMIGEIRLILFSLKFLIMRNDMNCSLTIPVITQLRV